MSRRLAVRRGYPQRRPVRQPELVVVRVKGRTYRVREDRVEGFLTRMGHQRPKPLARSGLVGHIEAISRGQ